MRIIIISLLIFIAACSDSSDNNESPSVVTIDSPNTPPVPEQQKPVAETESEVYANDRFKNVRVKKIAPDTYQLTGEGQIFEASFSWVIEDGHNELQSGHNMTDAGAPAWGKFDFTVKAPKEREHSVLHLILFEASAQDGRRTHELPVLLD